MAEVKNTNQSVGKALQIIDVLADSLAPMRLQDIAAAVGMPASTVLRMLSTLKEYGYIIQDEDSKKYYLTLKFARIGAIVSARFTIRELAHPTLLKLAMNCGEAASLAIEEDRSMIYIDVTDGPDGLLKITQRIGKRSPMHCTGVGKCVLLNYGEEELDELISTEGLPSYTANTIVTKQRLVEELELIRARGFAMDDQECELGARCIAAPIRDYTGKVVAGISVSGPVGRMTYSKVELLSKEVVRAANSISRELAYTGKETAP